MIPTRRRPLWVSRSPRELKFLGWADTLAEEQRLYSHAGDVTRALGRAERAMRTAARVVHEMDHAA